jgi:Uma2 family endonuclease
MSAQITEPEVITYAHWTVDLLWKIPHIEGERYELIKGELHVTTQPHGRHQRASARIARFLDEWSEEQQAGATFVAPGVIYAKNEAVAPDVVWVSAARLEQILGKDGKLHDSPDLVVELLSPGKANAERDREKKLELYSRRGVQEYWIADWQAQTVEVYRPDGDELRLAQTLVGGETIESPLLPGFSCLIDRFFAL